MYLKKLTIQGFKSFARKTVIDFEPGITGVVGPNGSGKSNVSDAIKWVLGEQSMKNIRSKKSGDVIFSGSEKSSKSSMAEVTLELDNSNKIVPIDFTDVSITRRNYRSGESDYLLNGAKARLLDITEILSKSGFGRSTYTVIGQGMVDKLITQSAEERRELFQDASGVKHYYVKRDQALKKFKETKDNLVRVSDVLREIKPRLSGLERKQKEAEDRKVLTDELWNMQKKYYGSELLDIGNLLSESEKKSSELGKEIENVQKEIAQVTKKLESRTDSEEKLLRENKEKELDGIENKMQEIQNALFQDVRENALLLEKKKFYRENLESLVAEYKEIQSVISNKEKQIADLRERQTSLKVELEKLISLKQELSSVKEDRVEPKEIILKIKEALAELYKKISAGSFSQVDKISEEIKDLITYLDSHDGKALESNETERIKVDLQIEKIRSDIESWEKLVEEALQVVAVQKEKAENLDKQIREAQSFEQKEETVHGQDRESQLKQLQERRDSIKKEIEELKRKSSEKEEEFFEVEKSYREKRDIESQYKDEMTRVEIEMARLKTKREDINAEIAELGAKESDLEMISVPAEERQVLLKRMNELRRKLEFMGGAISREDEDEYKEVKERFEFLTSQSEDLENALKSAKKVVFELEQKIHDQFHENFEKISQKFNHYFIKLFGGGTAKLILRQGDVEKENDEEMIIDIQAIPPGKRMHTLNTLSGGEKSLTSVALLFAIFSVNPTPFCVLDEVDAALDESNSMRFASLLGELGVKTQFIVVTHNRETMRRARNLYGVTMDDDKISKVLSLRLEDAQKYSK